MENELFLISVERIRRMEEYYDRVRAALAESPEGVLRAPDLCYATKALALYMESGAWLGDYELDERGLLPPELKRGVLSQDGLYDLLRELDTAKAKRLD